MTAIRTPRTTAAATALTERYAAIEGEIGAIEAARNAAIAEANASADAKAEQLLADRDAIRDKLEAWWPSASAELTKGKRKTVELGGCMIGTKAGRISLSVAADEVAVAITLSKRPWATGLTRTKVSLDKAAILKGIDGPRRRELTKLGFGKTDPGETFVLERAEQEGTRA